MIAVLTGVGRIPWSEAKHVLSGLTCAWAGTDGWRVASDLPDEAPLGATHLWGWSNARWARARLDGDEAIVGVLSSTELAIAVPPDPLPIVEEVEVRIAEARPWQPDDVRLPRASRGVVGGPITMLEVVGPTPLTFWHLDTWPQL